METLKVLGQSAPPATTFTDLYTVPSSKSTVVSTITICNRGLTKGTFRIAVRPMGAMISNQHYMVYNAVMEIGAFTALTLGITLGTTDIITVYASTSDFSFSAFGSEVV